MSNASDRKTAKAIAERIAARYVNKRERLTVAIVAHEAAMDAIRAVTQ